ncbi:MAG: immunoglobulin domain-containing protein [Phycisphaerales bacterium]|nr:immunoglobulin domain-containing protein [Phycisphaerales bacterium]
MPSDAITISVWFRTTTTQTGSGNNPVLVRWRTNGLLLFLNANGPGLISGNVVTNGINGALTLTAPGLVLNDDFWHLVSMTYNGNQCKLYVDGLLRSETTKTGSISYGGGGLALARDGDRDGAYFVGRLDDFRIYNRALSADEVLALYEDPTGDAIPALHLDNLSVCADSTATLSVSASGAEPFAFQWRKAGENLDPILNPSVTTPNMALTNLQAADAGAYDCVVSNSCGSLVSNSAKLDVYCECSDVDEIGGNDDGFALPRDAATPSTSLEDALFNQNPRDLLDFDMVPNVAPPDATPNRSVAHTFSGLPGDLVSATLEFRVQAGGSNQQNAEGTDLIRLGFAIGSGAAAEFENQGDNAFFWTRYFGSGNSTEALFTDGSGQPVPWRLGDERLVTLDLAALPLPPQTGGGTTNFLPQINARGYLDFVVSDDSGVDFVRLTGVRSDGTTVVWVRSQPQDQVACSGGVASFEITSGGSDPRTYRWRKNEEDLVDGLSATGSSISGTSTPMLTLTDVTTGDAGAYDCVVANDCSESTSTAAMLTVFDGGTGDGDASGMTDGEDIRGFASALLEGGAASSVYCAFDMNADGIVDFDDTGLFVQRLIGP